MTSQKSWRIITQHFAVDNLGKERKFEGSADEVITEGERLVTYYGNTGIKESTERHMSTGENLVYLDNEPVLVKSVLPGGRCTLVVNSVLPPKSVDEYCDGNQERRYISGFITETLENCTTSGGIRVCRREMDNKETEGDSTFEDGKIHYSVYFRRSPYKLYTMTLFRESENSRTESIYEMRTAITDAFPSKFDPRWNLKSRQIEDGKISDLEIFANTEFYDKDGHLTRLSTKTML